MAILTTGDLTIPKQILNPWLKNVSEGSVVSQLSGAIPMKFGKGEAFTFDIGEAEYVGEGANKGPSTITSQVQTVEPYKFHKTVRWTEEVQWADEDHQLGVVEEILSLIQPSLSRALDFGILHGIDPNTGNRPTAMTRALTDTTNAVTTGSGVGLIDAADALVLASGNVPSDMALAPGFAGQFATARDSEGRKLYPGLTWARTCPSSKATVPRLPAPFRTWASAAASPGYPRSSVTSRLSAGAFRRLWASRSSVTATRTARAT